MYVYVCTCIYMYRGIICLNMYLHICIHITYVYVCTCMYMYIHVYICIEASCVTPVPGRMHANTQAHIHKFSLFEAHTPSCTHTYTNPHMCAYVHTYRHPHARTHIHTNTLLLSPTHTHTHTYMYTHARTHAHMHKHTYIHIHTHVKYT